MSKDPKVEDLLGPYVLSEGEHVVCRYVNEVLGVRKIDPWQEAVLKAYARGENRIGIKSGHGVGKTATLSWIINYNLDCVYPQLTAATAPTKGQMEDALLKEVFLWFGRKPDALKSLYEVKTHRISYGPAPEESFFTAATARAENPEALQGKHAPDHGKCVLIADEGSGVHELVYESAGGSLSAHNATMIAAGNPIRGQGYFYNIFNKWSDAWFTLTVSYQDSPRVDAAWADEIKRNYGERSAVYRVRCLGEFPIADKDTVIPFELVESARGREITEHEHAPHVWGLDVARYGDDRNALVDRTPRVVHEIEHWGDTDLMGTAGRVAAKYNDTLLALRPKTILVDVIGLGAGVVDRLRELKLPARGINVAETAALSDKYQRTRDELWFRAREWLQNMDTSLPTRDPRLDPRHDPAEMLAGELTMPKFSFRSNGKYEVESKADMKKRGEDSPNIADAFVLTFAERNLALTYGSQVGTSAWDEPLNRGLVAV